MTAAGLWDRLQAQGLLEGEYAPLKRVQSPWFVRVMLGFAGWIGALFLLGFVGMAFAFVMTSGPAAFVLGLLLCGGAFFLLRAYDDNDFAEQFGLAVSFAGKALMVVGLAQMIQPNNAGFYLLLAAIEAMLVFLIPNFLHRLLSSAGAGLAVALGLGLLQLHGLAAPLIGLALAAIWLEPRRWATDGDLWRPIGYGLVLALLLVEVFRLFDLQTLFGLNQVDRSGLEIYGPWIGRAATGAILVWLAVAIATREGSSGKMKSIIAAGAFLFGLLTLPAPGLASAMLILLLGFSTGNRLLMTSGILALLGFVSHFYYSLHSTLLEKSALLALTGLILLAAYAGLRYFLPAESLEEAGHA